MSIARIENGAVVEIRDIEIDSVPVHKRGAWRTVVDLPPDYDPRIERRSVAGWQITETEALRQYTITPHARPMMIQAVKAEAQRRIIAATGATDIMSCLTKQMNAQMRGAELINIKASGGTLTAEQQAEATALQALADTIKIIRSKSNEIESLDPIPADYAADARWQ